MAAPLISGQELFSKMNALLNDPNYILPDDLSESDRSWIRTGINMLSQDPPPNPAISFANARSRTFRAPHGGRKSRNKKRKSKKQTRNQRQSKKKNH